MTRNELPMEGRGLCSVVMPVFNESAGLSSLVRHTIEILRNDDRDYEIVIVDDGSSDDTWNVVQRLHGEDSAIKGIRFSRNFGHQLAVLAGIKAASGEVVVVMDSDGQDPPELLPRMCALIEQGHDVVNCVRKNRKESALARLSYFVFYRLYSRLVPFTIAVDSGDFSAFNRKTANIIASVNKHTPFIRGIRSWAGGSQINLPYERQARLNGRTKYSSRKLFLLAMNGITGFSKVPLRVSIILGLTLSAASISYAVLVVFMKLFAGYSLGDRGWASLATIVLFLGGAQLTVLGIIGEYLGHIFDASGGLPPYHVEEDVGFQIEAPGPSVLPLNHG